MLEVFSYAFMQRAIIAGILVGFVASYYGAFVVQRRMSFMGSGLAHTAFGGIALGLLLESEPLWIAIPFTVIVSILITWIKQKAKISVDTSIGILFSVSVALGIIFISLKEGYSVDAFTYLFGSILSVNPSDLWF
ncbi:metal ABC transporter permease, partial [Bacteroidetes/Chlorobi group bacterium ChocPot_Mid]